MKTKSVGALLLCACMVFSLIAFSACSDKNANVRNEKSSRVVMTVGDREISALEFQIVYSASVQSYVNSNSTSGGISLVPDTTRSFDEQMCTVEDSTDKTWAQYFTDYTVSYCKEIYSVYEEATKLGIKPDDEYVSDQLDGFKSAAASAVKSGDAESESDYIVSSFGSGVTIDDIKSYIEVLSVYSLYYEKLQDETSFTDAEKEEFYEENKENLDAFTVRLAFFNEYSKTNGLNLDGIEGLSSMSLLEMAEYFAENYTSSQQDFADGYTNNFMTTDMLVSYGTADVTLTYNFDGRYFDEYDPNFYGWINSPERKEGDVYVVDSSSSGATFVIYFVEKDTRDYKVVNIHEMLIDSDKDEEVANKWNESDKSKDAFVSLVKEYNTDPNVANDEGYHSGVFKGYLLFTEMNEWLFKQERKSGDWEVFETSSGTVYLYFDSYGDRYRDQLVEASMFNVFYKDKLNELIENYVSEINDTAEIWKEVPAANGSASEQN